ncbi:MAG: acyl--CoA ligase [Deltaproteobacteria bacterium]|nr:acyl--CoA ligase [Deltaproteobacteria bacterium]HDM09905.1 long-chain fatty acid--CoA ligase [Desulfobacteraceae bacterium]
MNFADYLRNNAFKYPKKVSLIERHPAKNHRRTLTWEEFNAEANRIGNYLKKEVGIQKGDRVLHLFNNSVEWLTFYFGIIKIGAVVVPLNFRFIESDIIYAANVAEPVAFVFGSEFQERILNTRDQLDTVRAFITTGDQCPEDMIPFSCILNSTDVEECVIPMKDEDDLAVMFTSGTTGNPKAVVHTHGSMNATAIGNGLSLPLAMEDNFLIVLPLYHSGSLFMWFPYLAVGAPATLIREYREPVWLLEAIHEEKATAFLAVVPICVDLLNQIENREIDLSQYDLSSWKYIITGAQPVPPHIFKKLMSHLPCRIVHAYGTTEAGGGATWTIYHDEIVKKPGSIGVPNFGVEGRIFNGNGNEVAPGEVGELLIKTPRLMKCYYKNPELTGQCIRDGFFYTGDLARRDEDGYYYIVDRKKDMITSGGENIYPVEIEEVLHEHPDVDDAAVIGYPDKRFVEIVMAVVQLKEGRTLSEESIIDFCKSRLAMYKVPRKVVFDRVPRNPTGKLLKTALREKYCGAKEAFRF